MLCFKIVKKGFAISVLAVARKASKIYVVTEVQERKHQNGLKIHAFSKLCLQRT
jgi:hypothetical protein